MTREEDCQHVEARRCKDPYETHYEDMWVCVECGAEFVSKADAVATFEQVEEEGNRMLDMVAGVFSATLWDLHQRTKEAGQIDGPINPDELNKRLCEEEGHDRGDDGRCKRCGDNPFLGGGDG